MEEVDDSIFKFEERESASVINVPGIEEFFSPCLLFIIFFVGERLVDCFPVDLKGSSGRDSFDNDLGRGESREE